MARRIRTRKQTSQLKVTSLEDRLTPAVGLNLVAIDPTLPWADQIAATVAPGTATLSLGQGSFSTFVSALEDSTAKAGAAIEHLALVAHGNSGTIRVGGQAWSLETIAREGNRLAALFAHRAAIDLYACDVANGPSGRAFAETLAHLTGANVRASVDAVGSGLHGDFDWEFNSGQRSIGDLLNMRQLEQIEGLMLEDALEPNNTRPDADSSDSNFGMLTSTKIVHNLQLQADSSDWYRFETAAVGTVEHFVRLEFNNANGDLDMLVTAPDGTTIGASGGAGDVQQISLAGRPSGIYYVQVFNRFAGTGNSNYTLQITPPAAKSDDAYEQNDVKADTDIPTGPNSPNLGLLTGPKNLTNLVMDGNDDWFKFQMTGVGTTNDFVRLEFVNANGDLDLFLFADDGTLVGSAGGGADVQQVSLAGRPTGTYYVEVAPRFGFTGNTDYSLQIRPPAAAPDDVYEDNDTKAMADAPIGPGSPNLGVVAGSRVLPNLMNDNENDWFRFTTTVDSTTDHYVRLEFNNDNGDLDLFVYREDGLTLVNASGGGSNVQQVSMSGRSAGTYYVLVAPRFGFTGNADYTLQIMAPGSGLTVNQPTLVEGDAGTTNMLFTVGRSNLTGAASFNFATADGTATAGEDYQSVSGTISFADGESSRSFTVPIIGDSNDEPDENFVIRFTNGVGITVANMFASGRIIDDEVTGPIEFSASNFEVKENAGVATVRVRRTGDIGVPVSVDIHSTPGTAETEDFAATAETIAFAAGEAEKIVTMSIVNDTESESAETILLAISNPTGGAKLASATTATVTIIDDDIRPGVFQFNSATYSSSESSGFVTITVDRVGGSSGPATVKYSTGKKTAVPKSDFTMGAGTLSFADGETSKTFTVAIADDSGFEPNEDFTVTLKSPTGGATLGPVKSATVTIVNDDALMTKNTIAVGSGSKPTVNVIDVGTGKKKFSIPVYPSTFKGGIRVATGDVTGDGVPDILTAPGSSAASQVKVFDGFTGLQLVADTGTTSVFPASISGGVNIAAADLNGDDRAEIIVASGAGVAGQLRVFDGSSRALLFDISVTGSTSGVAVAVGDVDGDGTADLIAGNDNRVQVFSGDDGIKFTGTVGDFEAFNNASEAGITVAAGDIDGDGKAEIVVGSGPGGVSEVRVYSGADHMQFFAITPYSPKFTGGVRVALGDANNDGVLDILVAGGAGKSQKVKAYDWGTQLSLGNGFNGFEAGYTGGLYIGGVL